MPWMTRLASPLFAAMAITAIAEPIPTSPSVRTPVGLPCRSREAERDADQHRNHQPQDDLGHVHGAINLTNAVARSKTINRRA
jgi:hypothetical protein